MLLIRYRLLPNNKKETKQTTATTNTERETNTNERTKHTNRAIRLH